MQWLIDIVLEVITKGIKQFTADGADINRTFLAAGGEPTIDRGAYLELFGNEHPVHPGVGALFGEGGIGVGTNNPTHFFTLQQTADSNCIRIYGFDDMSAKWGSFAINQFGNLLISASSYLAFLSPFDIAWNMSNLYHDWYWIKFGTPGDFSMGYHVPTDSFRITDGPSINANVRFTLLPSGYIGIGTITPSYPLQVNGGISGLEKAVDPAEPAEGEYVIWMSDGTGKGDDGDVLIASKAGGVAKWGTLFDHSAGAAW